MYRPYYQDYLITLAENGRLANKTALSERPAHKCRYAYAVPFLLYSICKSFLLSNADSSRNILAKSLHREPVAHVTTMKLVTL